MAVPNGGHEIRFGRRQAIRKLGGSLALPCLDRREPRSPIMHPHGSVGFPLNAFLDVRVVSHFQFQPASCPMLAMRANKLVFAK